MLVLKDLWRTICSKAFEGSCVFAKWYTSALVVAALHEPTKSNDERQVA